MAVFFSKNNTEPYEVLDNLKNLMVDTYVDSFKVDEIREKQGTFYLVVQDEKVNNLQVEVTKDTGFGISFEISLADLLGNPTEWTTKVNLGDIDATGKTLKYLFYYRWRVINNLQIVKPGNYTANLVAYGEE